MSEFTYHLHAGPFELIAAGRTTMEAHLFDAKRQGIRPGDTLHFVNSTQPDRIATVTVTGITQSPTFRELFEQLGVAPFGGSNINQADAEHSARYTDAEIEQYGVVGIAFRLVPTE